MPGFSEIFLTIKDLRVIVVHEVICASRTDRTSGITVVIIYFATITT